MSDAGILESLSVQDICFRSARREATRDGAPAIDLIDCEALCDLLKQTRIGVAITLVGPASVDEAAFRTL